MRDWIPRLMLATLALWLGTGGLTQAQTAVPVGSGSYASSIRPADTGALQIENSYTNLHLASAVTNRPIPSNQWWTDLMFNSFGNQLWAYPVMLSPNAAGFNLHFPNAWTPRGADPWVPQGGFAAGPALQILGRLASGSGFTATQSLVTDWRDWGIQFALLDATTNRMDVTLVRGVPFVWTKCTGVKPRLNLGAATALYNTNGSAITRANNTTFVASEFSFDYQGRSYGVFAPDGTSFLTSGDIVEAQLSGTNNYLIYGLLPGRTNLAEFAQYAYARVTNTTYGWSYNSTNGRVTTTWNLAAEPLKNGQTNTLQGWLPHHYRTTSNGLAFKPYTYLTPRGQMKVAAGNQFGIDFNFRGIAPVLPAPQPNNLPNDYVAGRMTNYVVNFTAGHPQSIADTYFGGKELGITAQVISMARQLGMTNQAAQLTTNLRTLLANWYTYTPGEAAYFFARYNKWRALVGFPTGFGSEAFNDHHFHYGYFVAASALVGMEDASFLTQYGPMAKLVAKEYANWERSDTNFPFLRTFDIWAGHSWAGGLSSNGGNNQESSSEAMNAWAGLFLLGSQLGDSAMQAAGAMGYAVESTTVNEYWQDMYRTNFPASYGKGIVGILWSWGLAYGTYFSGDPAWIYGIQWVPAQHWNNYLSRNKSFANSQLTNMWHERVVASQYGLNGFTLTDSNNAPALGGYLGNYILGYQTLFDSAGVAAIMDAAYATNAAIATDGTYAGVTYYLTHSLRRLGDQDEAYYTSLPTSQVYYNPATGARTAVIYNPATTNQTATIYHLGTPVDTVTAPAGKVTLKIAGQTNAPRRLAVTLQLGAQVSWPTKPNTTWTLQAADAPGTNVTWSPVLGPAAGNGATQVVFEPSPRQQYRAFELTAGVSNIAVNGGFETGSGSGVSSWSAVGSQPATRISTDARTGSYCMQLVVTNPAATPNTAEINQNIGAAGGIPVVAGQSCNFSFWAKQISYGVSYVQNYRIGWLNSSGGTISSVGYTAFSASGSAWTQTSASNLVAPAGTVNAYLQIYGATGAVSNGYGGVLIDDVSLSFGTASQTNIVATQVQPGLQFAWPSLNGKLYDVRWTDHLTANAWSNLFTSLPGNGSTNTAIDVFSTNQHRFYRVAEQP